MGDSVHVLFKYVPFSYVRSVNFFQIGKSFYINIIYIIYSILSVTDLSLPPASTPENVTVPNVDLPSP